MAKHYTLKMETIRILEQDYPILYVSIFDTPSLTEIVSLMKEINKQTSDIKEKYISVTDVSRMRIGDFLMSIIMYGMKSKYKSVVSVKNPAAVSFVIVGSSKQEEALIKDTLKSINEINSEDSKEYKYNYVFIKDKEEIYNLALKFLK